MTLRWASPVLGAVQFAPNHRGSGIATAVAGPCSLRLIARFGAGPSGSLR
jgi:hypothetical protein